ncbi:MAG: biopolymer transporter ExbD [Gammaproteobacteria bacterium]|nr:biopolymer transporter ExbD [Gammaproteobacteria bacterium]
MEQSRRVKRMERHHKQNLRKVPLNLVSLMDIFTILVFFLLVNSGDVDVLPNAKTINLPKSVAEEKPRQNVVVMVTDRDIIVQGRKVASVADSMKSKDMGISSLKTALEQQAARILRGDNKHNPEVTIMGDREIPYRLLKKVMVSCTEAKYARISLAVMQKGEDA